MKAVLLGAALLLTPSVGVALDCPSLAGVDALWARPNLRTVVVGEMHGTVQAPALFGDLVCHSASSRPTVAALEFAEHDQPAFDAYMNSDGGPQARTALLASSSWTNSFKDGRSSQAMLELVERLRRMKAAGMPVRVIISLPTAPKAATSPTLEAAQARVGRENQDYHELAMAARWGDAVRSTPDGRVLALVGNLHASKVEFPRMGIQGPAASRLPEAETVTLAVAPTGGKAWGCRREGCREFNLPASRVTPRGVVLHPETLDGYDGELSPGEPARASPPAVSAK